MSANRSLRDKCQLEVIDDAVNHGIVGDEGDDAHLSTALRADQRVDFKNLADHLCPFAARDSRAFLLNDDEGMLVHVWLAHLSLASAGTGLEFIARVTSHIPDEGRVTVKY